MWEFNSKRSEDWPSKREALVGGILPPNSVLADVSVSNKVKCSRCKKGLSIISGENAPQGQA